MRMRAPGAKGAPTHPQAPFSIVIGDSGDAVHASEIASVVNQAYGRSRTSANEIANRPKAGGTQAANRVLHLAYREGHTAVGCISSTPPWGGGCGQWGFLAVAVAGRGGGVAAALVGAAGGGWWGTGVRTCRLSMCGVRAIQLAADSMPGACAWDSGRMAAAAGWACAAACVPAAGAVSSPPPACVEKCLGVPTGQHLKACNEAY